MYVYTYFVCMYIHTSYVCIYIHTLSRAQKRAETMQEQWAEQGFQTYVPLSAWSEVYTYIQSMHMHTYQVCVYKVLINARTVGRRGLPNIRAVECLE